MLLIFENRKCRVFPQKLEVACHGHMPDVWGWRDISGALHSGDPSRHTMDALVLSDHPVLLFVGYGVPGLNVIGNSLSSNSD